MIKIDVVSLTGLTAVDGSIVDAGAIIRFESRFRNGSNSIKITPQIYRSRELFEAGFEGLRVLEIPYDFEIEIPDEEYYVMTPQLLFEKVKDELNNMLGGECFDIQITQEEETEE